jgi:hypothetical protein
MSKALKRHKVVDDVASTRTVYIWSLTESVKSKLRNTSHQGLTLVHVRAQLEQLQDTFIS